MSQCDDAGLTYSMGENVFTYSAFGPREEIVFTIGVRGALRLSTSAVFAIPFFV